jgi:hypothetical protein
VAARTTSLPLRVVRRLHGIFDVPYKKRRAFDGMQYRGVANAIKNNFFGPDGSRGGREFHRDASRKWL